MANDSYENYLAGLKSAQSSAVKSTRIDQGIKELETDLDMNDDGSYTDEIVNFVDGDTPVFKHLGKIRSAPTNKDLRFDAEEVDHSKVAGFDPSKYSKSSLATSQQKKHASLIIGKPESEITQQDIFDVGNMQTAQRLSDLKNREKIANGGKREIVPFTPNSVAPDQSWLKNEHIKLKVNPVFDNFYNGSRTLANVSTGGNKNLNLTDIAANDPRTNAFTDLNSSYFDENRKKIAKKEDYNHLGWFGKNIINPIKGGAKTVAKMALVDTADLVGDGLNYLTDGAVGFDLGTEEEKDKYMNKLFGYNDAGTQESMAQNKKLIGEMWDDGKLSWSKLKTVLVNSITDVDMLVNSVATIGTMVATLPKTALKGSTKLLAEELSTAKKLGIKEGKTSSEIAKEAKTIKNKYTLKQRTLARMSKDAGFHAVVLGDTNNRIDEYKKNNDGKDPSVPMVAAMTGIGYFSWGLDKFVGKGVMTGAWNSAMNSLGIKKFTIGAVEDAAKQAAKTGDKQAFKTLYDMVKETAKKVGSTKVGSGLTTAAALGIEQAAEGGQEMVQQMAQILQEQWGTSKFGNDPIEILGSKDNIVDTLTAGAGGIAGSQQFQIAGASPSIAKSTYKGAKAVGSKVVGSKAAGSVADKVSGITDTFTKKDDPSVYKQTDEEAQLVNTKIEDGFKRYDEAMKNEDLGSAHEALKDIEAEGSSINSSKKEKLEFQNQVNILRNDLGAKLKEKLAEEKNLSDDELIELGAESHDVKNPTEEFDALVQASDDIGSDRDFLEKKGRSIGLSDKKIKDTIDGKVAYDGLSKDEGSDLHERISNINKVSNKNSRASLVQSVKNDINAIERDNKNIKATTDKMEKRVNDDFKISKDIDATKETFGDQSITVELTDGTKKEITYADVIDNIKGKEDKSNYKPTGIYSYVNDQTKKAYNARILLKAKNASISLSADKDINKEIENKKDKMSRAITQRAKDELQAEINELQSIVKDSKHEKLKDNVNKAKANLAKVKKTDKTKYKEAQDKVIEAEEKLSSGSHIDRHGIDSDLELSRKKKTLLKSSLTRKKNQIENATKSLETIVDPEIKNQRAESISRMKEDEKNIQEKIDNHNKSESELIKAKFKIAEAEKRVDRLKDDDVEGSTNGEIAKDLSIDENIEEANSIIDDEIALIRRLEEALEMDPELRFKEKKNDNYDDLSDEAIQEIKDGTITNAEYIKILRTEAFHRFGKGYEDGTSLADRLKRDTEARFNNEETPKSATVFKRKAKAALKVEIEKTKASFRDKVGLRKLDAKKDVETEFQEHVRASDIIDEVKIAKEKVNKKSTELYNAKKERHKYYKNNPKKKGKKTKTSNELDLINEKINTLELELEELKDDHNKAMNKIRGSKNTDDMIANSVANEKLTSKQAGTHIEGKSSTEETSPSVYLETNMSKTSGMMGIDLDSEDNKDIKEHVEKTAETLSKEIHQNDRFIMGAEQAEKDMGGLLIMKFKTKKNKKTGETETIKTRAELNLNAVLVIETVGDDYIAKKAGELVQNDQDTIRAMAGLPDGAKIPAKVASAFKHGKFTKFLALDLGREIAKELGIRVKDNSLSEAQEISLYLSLGYKALQIQMAKGTIERQGKLTNQQMKNIYDGVEEGASTPMVKLVGKDSKGRLNTLKKAKLAVEKKGLIEMFDLPTDKRGPSFTPPDEKKRDKQRKVANTVFVKDQYVSDDSRRAMTEFEDQEYTMDMEAVKELMDLEEKYSDDPEGFMKILSLISSAEVDNMTADDKVTAEAQNEANLKAYDELVELYNDIKNKKVPNTMWFNWMISKNIRMSMDSTTINPQQNKLHRFFVRQVDSTAIIDSHSSDINEKRKVQVMKMGIAQSFGYAIDKKHPEKSIGLGDALINMDPKELDSLYNKLLLGEKITIFSELNGERVKFDLEKEHLSHLISGKRLIKQFKKHEKDGSSFETNFVFEIDGITNGVILKELQFPTENYQQHLKMGGIKIYNKNDVDSNGDYDFKKEKISYVEWAEDEGEHDSYQNLGKDIETATEAPEGVSQSAFDSVTHMLPSADHVDGKVSSFIRNLVKYPLMHFSYASFLRTIKKNVGLDVTEKMPQMLLDVAIAKRDDIDTSKMAGNKLFAKIMSSISDKKSDKDKINNIIKVLKEKSISDITFYDLGVTEDSMRDFYTKTKSNKSKFGDFLVTIGSEAYGSQIVNSIKNEYGEMIEANRQLTNATKAMYQIFKLKFDNGMKQIKKDNGGVEPTKSQREQLIVSLGHVFPTIKGPLPGSLVEFIDKKTRSDIKGSEKSAQPAVNHKLYGGNYSTTIQTTVPEFESPMNSGAVLMTQATDASLMSMMAQLFPFLNIHDAFVLGIGDAEFGAKNYSRLTLDLSAHYNLAEEAFFALDNVMKHMTKEEAEEINKTNKKIHDEATKKENKDKYDKKIADRKKYSLSGKLQDLEDEGSGEYISIEDVRSDLLSFAKENNKKREDRFNEKPISSSQIALDRESAYTSSKGMKIRTRIKPDDKMEYEYSKDSDVINVEKLNTSSIDLNNEQLSSAKNLIEDEFSGQQWYDDSDIESSEKIMKIVTDALYTDPKNNDQIKAEIIKSKVKLKTSEANALMRSVGKLRGKIKDNNDIIAELMNNKIPITDSTKTKVEKCKDKGCSN